MKKDLSFHDYVVYDLFGGVDGISSKRLFGGWGIYKDGIIFAIIIDGELFFKVGDENKKDFEKFGSHPFEYESRGKKVVLPYWSLPEEIMENREELYSWMDSSLDVSKK